jgi:hypothetical protein
MSSSFFGWFFSIHGAALSYQVRACGLSPSWSGPWPGRASHCWRRYCGAPSTTRARRALVANLPRVSGLVRVNLVRVQVLAPATWDLNDFLGERKSRGSPFSSERSGEDVIVARGRMILLDDRQTVKGERPNAVDAPAYTIPVATAGAPFASDGPVLRDRAVIRRGVRPGLNGEAASESVAAVAALAAVATLCNSDVRRRGPRRT